jgi:iron complex outermembrane recepter protein
MSMIPKFTITLSIILLSVCAQAQNIKLHISLKTAGNDSLTNATIQIQNFTDSTILGSQISKPTGNDFWVKPYSKYLINVSAIGFANSSKIVSVVNKAIPVSISLKDKANSLDTVTVISKKPLMRQEDDKTIVDAEVLSNSSTNAYEVLEKTPGAVVDADGNVYLNSATPATVYINGREMKMSTDDIATLLKSLPAGSVNKIEIIRTPSAKYDASNTGGIINVVLKKGVKLGTTGSVNLRYDQGVYGSPSAGFSINHSIGKINSYFSYQYTNRKYFEDIQTKRFLSADTLLSQKSSTKYAMATNYIGGGIDYAFNKKINLAYDLRLTANQTNNSAFSSNNIDNSNTDAAYFASQTPIQNNGNAIFISNSLSSKFKIDSIGSEWSNEVDYTYSRNNNAQSYLNDYLLPIAPEELGNGNSHTTANLLDIKSDLVQKLNNAFSLEAGLKISINKNDNQALYFTQTGNQAAQLDPYQTNTFSYNENINAFYAQLIKTYRRVTFKAGLRFENTNMKGNQIVPVGNPFEINRSDFFPYLFIKRPLFSIFGYPLVGNIIFRKSIIRPGYEALNPSPKFVDPFTYSIGKPSLRPQITTNYEINATFEDYPVFAVGVNDSKDVFSPVTYQNDSSKIAYRTYDNLGTNKEVYGRLLGGLPAGGKYFMYAGLQFNHVLYIGEYQKQPLNYGRSSWTLFTGHEYKFSPTLRVNLHAWMYINGFHSFYELKNQGALNMGITKLLMNKKLSVILSANDILRTNKTSFHLAQGSLQVNGTRLQDTRRLGLTLRYNFGITHKKEKKGFVIPTTINTDQNQ